MIEWIGVDFDGTLAEYHEWTGWNEFGKPIPAMVERVKRWLAQGIEVRIVTARIGLPTRQPGFDPQLDIIKRYTCKMSYRKYSDFDMSEAIADYTEKHVGARLKSQCYKDYWMIELWDDRAVQVVPNTGRSLTDEHEAEINALRGKAQGVG